MKKSSKEYSPKVGLVVHAIVGVLASYILVSLVVGKMAFHNETIGTIVPLLLVGIFVYLGIKVYKYVNLLRGATVPVTAVESSDGEAARTASPETSATAAPATSATAAPTRLTRNYIRSREAEVEDLLVEAEQILSAAEKQEDEFLQLKADYEATLAKARTRRP